jgi:hypothetical protein
LWIANSGASKNSRHLSISQKQKNKIFALLFFTLKEAHIFCLSISGSTDMIVYSKDCSGCGKDNLKHNPYASSTYNSIDCGMTDYLCSNQCSQGFGDCDWEDEYVYCLLQRIFGAHLAHVRFYTQSYGDGSSITGVLVQDVVGLGPLKTKDGAVFGAIQNVDSPNGGFEAVRV